MDTENDRKINDERSVERWGWYAILVTLVLVGLNLVIALASNSLAVGAEAFHNFADFLTSVAILVGLKFATRKSAAFPYGLYKLENLLSVGLAIMIFFTAYEFVHDALFQADRQTTVQPWMFAALVVVTLIPLLFSHYQLRAGRQANSPALTAAAKEFRTHVFTTGIVFISLLSTKINFPVDRIGVVIIALIIVKTGWELLSDGMRALLDASLSREILDQIQALIVSEPAVATVRWVNGRNAGRVRFVEAGVTLRVQDRERVTTVTQRLENSIRASIPHVERVLIHTEVQPRTQVRYAVPLQDTSGQISEHFSQASYFAFFIYDFNTHTITSQMLVENPCKVQEQSRGIQVAEWLVKEKVDAVLVIKSRQGKGPGYVLSNAGIEEKITTAATLAEAVEEVQRELGSQASA
jgi:cation diffusion facilitator family transporter